MTYPITPDPSIHTEDPTAPSDISKTGNSLDTLQGAFANLPAEIIQLIVNAILNAFGLAKFEGPIDDLLHNLEQALMDIPQGNIAGLFAALEGAGGDIIEAILTALGAKDTGNPLQDMIAALEALPGKIETVIVQAITGIPIIGPFVGEALGVLASFFQDLLALLGSPILGTSTTTGPPTRDQSLAQLIGMLDVNNAIPTSLFGALASSAAKNVLADPGFDTNKYIQGQGLWCWDGWIGNGAGTMGSIRTMRPGRIICYHMIGTSSNINLWGLDPNAGFGPTILEYLRTNVLGLGDYFSFDLFGLDPNYFEWVLVPYPAAQFPMGPSVNIGYQWMVNQINQTPGPFVFVMDSQGCEVGAAVYDEIRFGSLQHRNDDFLGAIALGNLRREEGHTFPGYPDPAPGTSGMSPTGAAGSIGPYTDNGNPYNPKGGNLIDTEDKWWDFCVAGDYFACTPLEGVTVDPGPDALGGNVGCIPGIPGFQLHQFYAFIEQTYNGGGNILTDIIQWAVKYGIFADFTILEEFLGTVMAQISALGSPASPHNCYNTAKPFEDQGDDRTFVQIGLDYLSTLPALAEATLDWHPPLIGTRHQLLGQRVAVQEFQVVKAGASTLWVNITAQGPVIIVGVNAYDKDSNLVATITVDECTISDPEPTSNWTWVKLEADFVMPPGTAFACLVLDVEPEAMQTGIVWFDDCVFEPTALLDGGWLDVTNIPQLNAAKVAGPQGEADLLSAWQNLIDNLASANSQTNISGVTLAQMLQQVGQTALNAETSLNLGVAHQQILGNPATQPLWGGLTVSGQVTFPLPTGTLPTVVISAGTSLLGFLNTSAQSKIGFVEFLASATSPSGIYLNVYKVDKTNGNMTQLWASSDISLSIGSTLSWAAIDIPSADQFAVDVAQLLLWEIVASGSNLTVVAETLTVPNKPYLIPPNVGASRSISTTGGTSPTSLTPSQLAYGGTAPFVCMSVSDLPPTYFPPNQSGFTRSGIYTYTIPSYLQAGDFIDLVSLGAGGAGGWVDGTIWVVNIGQGGEPGFWAAKTLVYGTDVPVGTTQLTVIVGHGGWAPGGGGGDTVVGYGTLSTPAFDAVGSGGQVHGTTVSWSHTAADGAYVLVGIASSWGTFDVKYGDETMTQLGMLYLDDVGPDGELAVFGIADVVGGTATITVNTATTAFVSGNSVSYSGVSSVGLVQNGYGTGTALSQSAMCSDKQMIVQFFGNQGHGQLNEFTGGTKRSYTYVPNAQYYSMGVVINDSPTSATFGATASVADNWGAVSVVLNPGIQNIVQIAEGGQGGGPGGKANYNPISTNQTNIGPGPGNQTWAGRTYMGGPTTTALASPGNQPGGASSGGTQAANPLGALYVAGDGSSWITARQGNSAGTSSSGGISGGGSELSVVYEATGGGGQSSTAGTTEITWAHNSSGGPNCAVLLMGSVSYSGGAASLTATYGSNTFTYNIGGVTYYNASGVAVFIFALALLGVPSGPQTVSLVARGATINDLAGNTFTYQNVGSIGDFDGNSGTGVNLDFSGLTSQSGSIMIAGFADLSQVINGFNHNLRWSQNVTASIPMVVGDADGSSSENFAANIAASQAWGAVGGVLLPAS